MPQNRPAARWKNSLKSGKYRVAAVSSRVLLPGGPSTGALIGSLPRNHPHWTTSRKHRRPQIAGRGLFGDRPQPDIPAFPAFTGQQFVVIDDIGLDGRKDCRGRTEADAGQKHQNAVDDCIPRAEEKHADKGAGVDGHGGRPGRFFPGPARDDNPARQKYNTVMK